MSYDKKMSVCNKATVCVCSNCLEKRNRFGQTQLHRAIIENHIKKIACLLNNGANMFAVDYWNKTPYDYAKSHPNIMVMLLTELDKRCMKICQKNIIENNIIENNIKMITDDLIKLIDTPDCTPSPV